MAAPKCCRATASSPITPTRQAPRSRRRTTTARSSVSHSTRPRISAASLRASRYIRIDRRRELKTTIIHNGWVHPGHLLFSLVILGSVLRTAPERRRTFLRVQLLQFAQDRFAHLRG